MGVSAHPYKKKDKNQINTNKIMEQNMTTIPFDLELSACLQGKLWTILMDCLISMNVPMEHYGTVAFLLRAMNVF